MQSGRNYDAGSLNIITLPIIVKIFELLDNTSLMEYSSTNRLFYDHFRNDRDKIINKTFFQNQLSQFQVEAFMNLNKHSSFVLEVTEDNQTETDLLRKYIRDLYQSLINIKYSRKNLIENDYNQALAKLGKTNAYNSERLKIEDNYISRRFYNKLSVHNFSNVLNKKAFQIVMLKNMVYIKKENEDIALIYVAEDRFNKKVEMINSKSVDVFTKKGRPNNLENQYIKDSRNFLVKRYIVRSITPQERVLLKARCGLKGSSSELGTEYENNKINNNIPIIEQFNYDDEDNVKTASGVLHRIGTRYFLCATASLKNYDQHSNAGKAFNESGNILVPYRAITLRRRKYTIFLDQLENCTKDEISKQFPKKKINLYVCVYGGGDILIDLAKMEKRNIHAQGQDGALKDIKAFDLPKSTENEAQSKKRDHLGNIKSSSDNPRISEKSLAQRSAYRNREVHLGPIPYSAIDGWRESKAKDFIGLDNMPSLSYQVVAGEKPRRKHILFMDKELNFENIHYKKTKKYSAFTLPCKGILTVEIVKYLEHVEHNQTISFQASD